MGRKFRKDMEGNKRLTLMSEIKIKIFSKEYEPEELLPEYKTEGSAGMDLKAAIKEPLIIKPHEIKVVPTGLGISLSDMSSVILVYARSGLASKYGISMANSVGVIDSDYRGEIFCPLINLSNKEFILKPLERMAQLVISPILKPKLKLVEDLGKTSRGAGGFGHTGR